MMTSGCRRSSLLLLQVLVLIFFGGCSTTIFVQHKQQQQRQRQLQPEAAAVVEAFVVDSIIIPPFHHHRSRSYGLETRASGCKKRGRGSSRSCSSSTTSFFLQGRRRTRRLNSNKRTVLFSASPTKSSSTTTTREVDDNNVVDGLLNDRDFDRLNAIHLSIQQIRYQIPMLLKVPFTEDSCKQILSDDVQFVVSSSPSPSSSAENNDDNDDQDVADIDQDEDDNDDNDNDDEIILSTSRKELISISTSLVLAVTASSQAGKFLTSFVVPVGGSGTRTAASSSESSKDDDEPKPHVDCKFILNNKPSYNGTTTNIVKSVYLEWETDVLPILGGEALLGGSSLIPSTNETSTSRIQGRSEFVFDKDNGKIRKIKLLSVSWNNQEQNAKAIGKFLSTLRSGVLNIQSNPLVKSLFGVGGSSITDSSSKGPEDTATTSPFASIFDQVRDEWLERQLLQSSSTASDASVEENLAPLYVYVDDENTTTTTTTSSSYSNTNSTGEDDGDKNKNNIMLLDEFENLVSNQGGDAGTEQQPLLPPQSPVPVPVPLPGSKRWEVYASSHRIVENFVRRSVPILSETGDRDQIRALLDPKVRLLTLDGSLLVQGVSRVSKFYHSISSWRARTFGSWTLDKATVLGWDEEQSVVRVNYTANISVPGTNAISITGSDVYVLSHPPTTVVDDPRKAMIGEIRQTSLSRVGSTTTSVQDGLLLLRGLATAVETGRAGDDSVLLDLLQRVGDESRRLTPAGRTGGSSSRKMHIQGPRNDEAAVTVYRIMDAFHSEIPAFLDAETNAYLPPAQEYMSENVQLLGYLGEPILRGRATYDRAFSLSVASLKAALRTGLVSEREPSIKVELTADRNVRLSLNFYLKFKPVPGFRPPFDGDFSGGGGLPFRLGIVSDYILDGDSGRILRHQLKETRINNQLTPGDLVSRWIQKLLLGRGSRSSSDYNQDAEDGAESLLRGMVDAVKWVRSLSDNKDAD